MKPATSNRKDGRKCRVEGNTRDVVDYIKHSWEDVIMDMKKETTEGAVKMTYYNSRMSNIGEETKEKEMSTQLVKQGKKQLAKDRAQPSNEKQIWNNSGKQVKIWKNSGSGIQSRKETKVTLQTGTVPGTKLCRFFFPSHKKRDLIEQEERQPHEIQPVNFTSKKKYFPA
ncbi:Protein of unknown function, partial [Gryllus bimaculatus]